MKVRLKALDHLLAASLYSANGDHQKAAKNLLMASEQADFDDTVASLLHANEEGWDDGVAEDSVEDELDVADELLEDEGDLEFVGEDTNEDEEELDEDVAETARALASYHKSKVVAMDEDVSEDDVESEEDVEGNEEDWSNEGIESVPEEQEEDVTEDEESVEEQAKLKAAKKARIQANIARLRR